MMNGVINHIYHQRIFKKSPMNKKIYYKLVYKWYKNKSKNKLQFCNILS